MRDKSVLLALAIAIAAVFIAVWRVIAMPSSPAVEELSAQESVEAANFARSPRDLHDVASPMQMNSSGDVVPARVDLATAGLDAGEVQSSVDGTTLLVVDFETGEPVERFAIKISRRTPARSVSPEGLAKRMKTFSRGAMLVPAEIDGYHYLIQAAGYPAQFGRVTTVSPTDRRAYIRLEKEVVVTGRVLLDGVPVKDAHVLLTQDDRRLSEAHGARTDVNGRFTMEHAHPALGQLHVYTAKLTGGEQFASHSSHHAPTPGTREYDLGDLQLSLPDLQFSLPDRGPGPPVDPGSSMLLQTEYFDLKPDQRK